MGKKWLLFGTSLIVIISMLLMVGVAFGQQPTGEFEVDRKAVEAYLTWDPENDPFILSVRKPEDDAKGRIPGAITIFWKDLWKPENLAKLPKDKKIVVYCYTGHTGGIAATILNLLGYDAVNLKFGMMGWTKNDEVLAQPRFNPATQPDYPVETAAPPALPVTGGEGSTPIIPLILMVFGGISLSAGVAGLFILRHRAE